MGFPRLLKFVRREDTDFVALTAEGDKEITGTLTVGERIISDFVPTVNGQFVPLSNIHLGDSYDGGNGNGYPTHLTINAPIPAGDEDEWQFFEFQVNGVSKCWLQGDMVFRLKGSAVIDLGVTTAQVTADNMRSSGVMDLAKMTAPAATPNAARLFAVDNGAGKTKLMVQMPSGTAIQLAIEA